jgi:hypothetical protein
MKALLLTIALSVGAVMAQQSTGTVKGQVLDELGGALVGASVVATDMNGREKTVTTNDQGLFVIGGLEPGKYKIQVATAGFAGYENPAVEIVAGRTQQLDITLTVMIEEQKVTVNSDSQTLSTEPENNRRDVPRELIRLEHRVWPLFTGHTSSVRLDWQLPRAVGIELESHDHCCLRRSVQHYDWTGPEW